MKHSLYTLEKIKITFEQYWIIETKLCQPIFNQPKFYAISHIVWYICNYGSAINYNIAYSKVVYKSFSKIFYNKTDKKEYNLQIQ